MCAKLDSVPRSWGAAMVFQGEEVCEALREMGVVQARVGGWHGRR